MRRRDVQCEPVRDALLSVFAAALLLWSVTQAPAPGKAGPKMWGPYELTFAGPGTGSGDAVVVQKMVVKIDGKMTGPHGNVITFSAKQLDFDGSTYRFKGTGMLDNSPAAVSGRLDPDDPTLKMCRFSATFVAADGRAGRIVGMRK